MRAQSKQGAFVLPAGAGAVDRLLALAEAFHRDGGHPLRDPQREAIRRLVAERALGRAWILASGGDDLGYATCAFALSVDVGGRAAILDDLYVIPGARGQGLGRLLMTEVETDLASLGVRTIGLMTDGADRRASRFYAGLGFVASPLVVFQKMIEATA